MRKKNWQVMMGKKFAGSFFWLFFLTLFTNYLSFLFRFNFQANLSTGTKGNFYWPFISQIFPTTDKNVDWPKLLLSLLFGYFLVKMLTQLALDYGQKYYERLITVYLTKYLLSWAVKNQGLVPSETEEKLLILPNLVTNFSHQLLSLLIDFSSLIINIILGIYSLYFFVRTRQLEHSFPFIFGFNLIILVGFSAFFFFLHSEVKRSEQESWVCQQAEKNQVRVWLKNLNFDPRGTNLKEMFILLDHNSSRLFPAFFASAFFRLPQLIIPGISILFCFFYYHYYDPKMNWNIYLIALNCQNMFWKISQILGLWPSWKSFRHNYLQLTSFFT